MLRRRPGPRRSVRSSSNRVSPRPESVSATTLSWTQVRAHADARWRTSGCTDPGARRSADRRSAIALRHAPRSRADKPSPTRMAAALFAESVDPAVGTRAACSNLSAAARRRPSRRLASPHETHTSCRRFLVSSKSGASASTCCRWATATLHRPSAWARSASARRALTRRVTSSSSLRIDGARSIEFDLQREHLIPQPTGRVDCAQWLRRASSRSRAPQRLRASPPTPDLLPVRERSGPFGRPVSIGGSSHRIRLLGRYCSSFSYRAPCLRSSLGVFAPASTQNTSKLNATIERTRSPLLASPVLLIIVTPFRLSRFSSPLVG